MKQSLIFLLFLVSFPALSQDMIVTTGGDNIPCKVVRITKKNIKYRLSTVDDTLLRSTPKQAVYVIKYEDGEKEFFHESTVDDSDENGQWNKDAMKEQGRTDAQRHYKGYGGAKTGAFVGAAIIGPILGLVPAIICASAPPKDVLLDYPDKERMKNDDYAGAYSKEARKIKAQKVWNGYTLGAVMSIALTVLILAL